MSDSLRMPDEAYIHSQAQLARLKQLVKSAELSPAECMFVTGQLVNHGFSSAAIMLDRAKAQISNVAMRDYLARLEARHRGIAGIGTLPDILGNAKLMASLYATEGHAFVRTPESRDLMVVFATLFNNFGVSTPVFVALLQQCGYSVLLLRDPTRQRFLNGSLGCAGDIRSLAEWIADFRRRENFERLFLTGYSSGGYPSLFATTMIRTEGYLGFSVETDFTSGGPPIRTASKPESLAGIVRPEFLCSLRERIMACSMDIPRNIYYGQINPVDASQAKLLRGLPGCTIEMVEDTGHELIFTLLEQGRLADIFANFRAAA